MGRYTDFLVNEIDTEGNVVHLTELGGKKQDTDRRKKVKTGNEVEKEQEVREKEAGREEAREEEVKGEKVREEITEEEKPTHLETTMEDRGVAESHPIVVSIYPFQTCAVTTKTIQDPAADEISALSTPEVGEFCSKLLRSIKNAPSSSSHPSLATPPLPRETRFLFHQKIREFSSGAISTSTLPGTPSGCIRIYATPKQNEHRRRGTRQGKRARDNSSRDGGDYCHFLLFKENRDTMEVMNLLPRLLNARGKNVFSFAGTKDRRAVTVQRCSALRVSAERLAGLNKSDTGLRGCKLGNFVYKPSGLELGDLGGNEFLITLRECAPLADGVGLEETVRSAMERVNKGGFINYFGLQRFGSFGVGTWEVGVQMLKGNWRGAVEKILDYDPALLKEAESDDDSISSEDRCRAEACAAFLKGYELERAASLIPRRSTAESCILRAFHERGLQADQNGNKLDYRAALQTVPRNLRTMYLHAYQSYVWNHVVSERIRWGAEKVIEGDLIIIEDGTTGKKQPLETAEAEPEVDQDGEVIVNADDQAPGDRFKHARPLTKEEAESGEFTMTDIVLPTPGWDVVYPKNALMDVYRDIMAEHELDPLNMRRNVKETSLPGSYRKVLGSFIQGEGWWEVKKYRGVQQLVQTDLEKINEAAAARESGGDKMDVAVNVEGEEGEEKSAVVLGMRLGTSTYATMALRELMKGGVKAYVPEFGRGEARKKVV